MLLVPAATEAALHEEELLAAQASPVPITTGSNTTAVGSRGCAVVKAVTKVVGAVVNATVRNVAHETTRAMCKAKIAPPPGVTMKALHSGIAKGAGPSAAVSQTTIESLAGSTALYASSSITSTNSQGSSSKRKADRDYSEDLRISSKRRTSSGGDDINPDAFQEQYSSCLTADQRNQPPDSTARVSLPNPNLRLMFRVKCLGQSSELTTRDSGRTAGLSSLSSPTLSSQALVRISKCLG